MNLHSSWDIGKKEFKRISHQARYLTHVHNALANSQNSHVHVMNMLTRWWTSKLFSWSVRINVCIRLDNDWTHTQIRALFEVHVDVHMKWLSFKLLLLFLQMKLFKLTSTALDRLFYACTSLMVGDFTKLMLLYQQQVKQNRTTFSFVWATYIAEKPSLHSTFRFCDTTCAISYTVTLQVSSLIS